ncbi:MAG: hypothetical protein EBT08_13745, partial [Betaproteobacteria bacterium]|nr:hypothetical protein [Betaproteobacteria bacterium]
MFARVGPITLARFGGRQVILLMMNIDPERLSLARAQWRWRGQDRPPFADVPAPGQVSVWDFPRPPELVRDSREIVVRWGVL